MAGWVGRTHGKVNVELLLERDAASEIYLDRHRTLQRVVAINVPNAQYADAPELLERLQRAGRDQGTLRNANIVQVHAFESVDGHPCIVVEDMPGVSLAAHLRAFHSLQRRDLMKQILASRCEQAAGCMTRQAVALSNNMLTRSDLNGNERIEAIFTEGGAQTACQHALHRADIVVALPNQNSRRCGSSDFFGLRRPVLARGRLLQQALIDRVPHIAQCQTRDRRQDSHGAAANHRDRQARYDESPDRRAPAEVLRAFDRHYLQHYDVDAEDRAQPGEAQPNERDCRGQRQQCRNKQARRGYGSEGIRQLVKAALPTKHFRDPLHDSGAYEEAEYSDNGGKGRDAQKIEGSCPEATAVLFGVHPGFGKSPSQLAAAYQHADKGRRERAQEDPQVRCRCSCPW